MKYKNNYHKNHNGELEVYKLQTALFGGPSVLIYNEDRTQTWEEHKPNNVKALQEFMGNGIIKCYACGYQNENGQIVLVDKVNDQKYFF